MSAPQRRGARRMLHEEADRKVRFFTFKASAVTLSRRPLASRAQDP